MTAKFLLGRVRSPAGWAGGTEWSTTLPTEIHAGRVVTAAMCAPHHTRTRGSLLGRRPPLSPTPQLLCRQPRPFAQCGELGPYDGRMHFARGREAGKAAIGAGDDILAPGGLREPRDALCDRLGMLDEIRAVCDDAGDKNLAFRQCYILPHPPLVFVPRVAGLERIDPGVD